MNEKEYSRLGQIGNINEVPVIFDVSSDTSPPLPIMYLAKMDEGVLYDIKL